MSFLRKIRNLFFYWQDDESLLHNYKKIGLDFGEMIFDRHLGAPVGYAKMLRMLVKYEAEVVARGYRAVPISLFTHFSGTVQELNVPLRNKAEKIICFADEWKKRTRQDEIFGDFLARVMESKTPIVEQAPPTTLFDHELNFMKEIS